MTGEVSGVQPGESDESTPTDQSDLLKQERIRQAELKADMLAAAAKTKGNFPVNDTLSRATHQIQMLAQKV